VHYLPGPKNVMADMLSRLPREGATEAELEEEMTFQTPKAAMRLFRLIESTNDPGFVLPTLEEFVKAQMDSLIETKQHTTQISSTTGLYLTERGKVFVPSAGNLR
jgi:hypothetical protein